MTDSQYCSAITQHYEKQWRTAMITVPFTHGPINELPPNFCILKSPPHGTREMWTYATKCMSQRKDISAVELHIFSPYRDDETIAELLVACSHYHRTGRALDIGHTINFGRPWIKGANCDHGLISLPYLDGPLLEWLRFDDKNIRFLWLVPITSSEAVFASKYGVERLEERLESSHLNYLTPKRTSVA